MITIRACVKADVPELARLNRMLIEDERAENDMTVEELEARMAGFLAGEYRAYFFEAEGKTVGYCLVNMTAKPLYLRHFCIAREARRMGYGTQAFHALLAELKTETIEIEVYSWNERGRAFWKALGFQERAIQMRFQGA